MKKKKGKAKPKPKKAAGKKKVVKRRKAKPALKSDLEDPEPIT